MPTVPVPSESPSSFSLEVVRCTTCGRSSSARQLAVRGPLIGTMAGPALGPVLAGSELLGAALAGDVLLGAALAGDVLLGAALAGDVLVGAVLVTTAGDAGALVAVGAALLPLAQAAQS